MRSMLKRGDLFLHKVVSVPLLRTPEEIGEVVSILMDPGRDVLDSSLVTQLPYLSLLSATKQGERYESNTRVLGHTVEVSRLMKAWEKAKGLPPVEGVDSTTAFLAALYHDIGKSSEVFARGIQGNYERHQLVSALIFHDEIAPLCGIPQEMARVVFPALRIHQTLGMFTTGEYLYAGKRLFQGPMKLQIRSGRIIQYSPEDLYLILGGDERSIRFLRALSECDVKSIRDGYFWENQKVDDGRGKQEVFDQVMEEVIQVKKQARFERLGQDVWYDHVMGRNKIVLWDCAADTDLVCDIKTQGKEISELVHYYSDDGLLNRRVPIASVQAHLPQIEWFKEKAFFQLSEKRLADYLDVASMHPIDLGVEMFSEKRFLNIDSVLYEFMKVQR